MKNTTLCYIRRDSSYLLMHRTKKEGDENWDKWIGVGGKCEEGESPEDCVVRETLEETGLTLLSYQYRGLVTFVSDRYPTEYMHLFTAERFSGELLPCEEGELAWVDRARMLSLPIWEGDRIFLELLEKAVAFFSLKLVYQGDRLLEAVLDGKPLAL